MIIVIFCVVILGAHLFTFVDCQQNTKNISLSLIETLLNEKSVVALVNLFGECGIFAFSE